MSISYLIGGGTLEGVTVDENQWVHQPKNQHSHVFGLSNPNYQDRTTLTLRKLGLNSDQFGQQLTQRDPRGWQELDGSRNRLQTIPAALEPFQTLTYLNLSCNHLTEISPALYRLTQLQQLILSENAIRHLPDALPHHLPHLTVLWLDDNRLTELPTSLGQWKKLRELRLGSAFGGNAIVQLPASLVSMRSLVELDLSFNQLRSISSLELRRLRRLRDLNVSHNRLRDLPEVCPRLTTLDLSDNQIGSLPAKVVGDWVRAMTDGRLVLLNLANNRLESVQAELLEQSQTQVILKGNPLSYGVAPGLSGESEAGPVIHPELALHPNLSQTLPLESESIDPLSQSSTQALDHDSTQGSTQALDHDSTQALEPESDINLPQVQRIEAVVQSDSVVQPEQQEEEIMDLEQDQLEPSKGGINYYLHSLKEICIRTAIIDENGMNRILPFIPEHMINEIKNGLQFCPQCQSPFVYEWVSTSRLKNYRGYPSIIKEIKFCSTQCLLDDKEVLNQQLLASQSHVTFPRQQALDYISNHPYTRESGSFDWIMAAVIASTEQEGLSDLLATTIQL